MSNIDLFQLFERGERRILRSRPSVILLIGAAKAGTSAVFNWVTGKPLKVVPHFIEPRI
jgi:hypothetical protein